VQTNSLPDHCFYSVYRFPDENLIDFEVRFDTPVSQIREFNIVSPYQANGINCNYGWVADGNLKNYSFVSHSGDSSKVVGIAFNGVPIYSAYSELFYDALYPKAYGSRTLPRAVPIDACMGSIAYATFYHYYSFSPCIVESTYKSYPASKDCDGACLQNKTYYMYSLWSQSNSTLRGMPIGIAKDGHKILSPFKTDGTLW
jgi:hypothetical protein